MHRAPDEDPELAGAPAENPQASAASVERQNLEAEVSKLKARLEAMETKLDVMSNSVDRSQMKQSQPQIVAETAEAAEPQASMAAPVSEQPVDSAEVSAAAVSKPAAKVLPSEPVARVTEGSTVVEKDFKIAMSYFQSGRNLEAAAKFSSIAKQFPNHLLAGHALYWAGEASARGQQWSTAIENWETVERSYSHSAYLADSLAGLSRAYEAEGNLAKAKQYRDNLTRSFPTAPVTMNLVTHSNREAVQEQKEAIDPSAPSKEDSGSTEQD